MTSLGFGLLPSGILPGTTPQPFTLHFPQADLDQLTNLAGTAVIGSPSYYNTHNFTDGPDHFTGVSRDWLAHATDVWTTDFDWPAREDRWNKIPQFTTNVTVPSDGEVFHLHFAALFSRKKDAVPIILSHGWPSAWFDFVPMLELVTAKYTPKTLPYHLIVPSIPDYGLSTRSNQLTAELNFYRAAEALNALMKSLGFNAYVAQGGDVGSGITVALGLRHEEVKAVHFNNFILPPGDRAAVLELNLPVTPRENASLTAANAFFSSGTGYLLEQGTKPSTISLVLMSNPVAMLAWIGTMYAEALGSVYPIGTVLEEVSWYWLTRSFGSAMWAYRAVWDAVLYGVDVEKLPNALQIKGKPVGYSWFPGEVLTVAKSWLDHWFGKQLVFFRAHESGGHLAALDEPKQFLRDIEDFVAVVKKKVKL